MHTPRPQYMSSTFVVPTSADLTDSFSPAIADSASATSDNTTILNSTVANEVVSKEWLWKEYCAHMQTLQSEAVYHTWILANPITQIKDTLGGPIHVTISSPTAFHASTLQRTFHTQIIRSLELITQRHCVVEYAVAELIDSPTGQASVSHAHFPHQQSKTRRSTSPRVDELFSESTVNSMAEERLGARMRSIGIRSDYTFETFAVSTTNEMAHAAATAVAQKPGSSYNPLFLYGGVGVGKTHLMHAIGHEILANNPEARIIYSTGEEFTNEIVQAIQTKKASVFKEKYRKADVLFIDDVQFIAGKNAVQEEFFHTFNALIKLQRQVVMTSDRPPHEITLLEDRLRSRFEAGLMIDIQQPSFELRTAIVLVKAKAQHLLIPIDFAKQIATHIDSARKIEGIITILRSEVELKGKTVSAELISRVLAQEKPSSTTFSVSAGEVIKAVANHFHVTQTALKGQSRVKHLVTSRHLCMFILKQDSHLPLVEIGRWFSGRDHTSVLHAIRKVTTDLEVQPQLQQDLSAIRTTLTTSSRKSQNSV